MPFKTRWGAICMAAMIVPAMCVAYPDPVPPLPSPDPMAQASAAIRQAMERADRVSVVLDGMTTPEVYAFYTRRNDLYKNALMRAAGAYQAMEFIQALNARREASQAAIMNRLRTETDPVARAALIARLPSSAPFSDADMAAAIQARIGELDAARTRMMDEEARYHADLARIDAELRALKRNQPGNNEAIGAKLQEKWATLAEIETLHRNLQGAWMERDALRDYAGAKDKDTKELGILRRVESDLRLFTGEMRDGVPVSGMRKLWADIQANIAANRAALAIPYQPGQAFFLKPPGIGNSANPTYPGFMPPIAAQPAVRPSMSSLPFMMPRPPVAPVIVSPPTPILVR